MLKFIPITSGETGAETLTGALWNLSRTAAQRAVEITDSLWPVVPALNGTFWLRAETNDTLVMCVEAEIDGIGDLLQPFEQAGQIPAGTVAGFEAWIAATRVLTEEADRTFNVWSKFPALFQNASKTPAEMIAAGLLPDPEVLP